MNWNFLYQIKAASRIPDQWATANRSPFSLSWNEFVEPPTPRKIPGYATDSGEMFSAFTQKVKYKVLYLSNYFTYISVSGLMYAQEISA